MQLCFYNLNLPNVLFADVFYAEIQFFILYYIMSNIWRCGKQHFGGGSDLCFQVGGGVPPHPPCYMSDLTNLY